ncbi:unnamed protein product [Lampetra fluviatilis]
MAAPLAHFDEDWQDLYELRMSPARGCEPKAEPWNSDLNALAASSTDNLEDFADLESFSGEIVSFKSMEDLVNDFDEKLTVCFRNFDTDTGYIAPVVPLAEQGLKLKDDEIWNAVTDNFGNVMPVDWSSSHARTLQIPTLNMKERFEPEGITLDLSDDEELREQLDMHSIIVSCINDEPIFTAEQVIEEIEEMMMMQESPDGEEEEEETPTQSDRLSLLSQEINALKRSSTNNSCQDRLKRMSMAGLTELLEEMESAARSFSEELVTQLARRDELDFEKEVNNSFISALIDVQNKQKEHRESLRRKKRRSVAGDSRAERAGARMPSARFSMENLSNVIQNGIRQTFGNGGCEKQYLTTVIPYEKKMGAPSVEDLQILTKILNAMKDDSDKVPALLTDYILKVLCPT